MKKITLILILVSFLGCKRNKLFLDDNSQWLMERGMYNNSELIYSNEKIIFYNTVIFNSGKIYFDVGADSSPHVNYEIARKVSNFLYEIRVWTSSDDINEIGFLLIDDLKNDKDSNGSSEILIHTPSFQVYLWKKSGSIFLPDKFGTNDLDLSMLPNKL